MKKTIAACMLALAPAFASAAGGGVHLDSAEINLRDTASLQRGAKVYFNYCYGCHSIKYMRYNRIGRDLGISDEQLRENFIFTDSKVGDLVTNAMPAEAAAKWFGKAPPDLSVTARSRGSDWLYTYMRSFYVDDARPLGVNNIVFPDVGMPHVLRDLQGPQKAVFRTETDAEGNEHHVFDSFELVAPGALSPPQYDELVRDLVNFLTYVGEPSRVQRENMGIWVILFLMLFTFVAYLLKKEYWKDIH